MKNYIFKNYVLIFALLLLAGIYGCQTEPLDAQPGLSTSVNSSAAKPDRDFEPCDYTTNESVDLYAGQNILVGQVVVDENGVTFEITEPGWCITETHLSVVSDTGDFPVNKGGNPQIGNFEYQMAHDCVLSYTYDIDVPSGSYVAAHAVVNCTIGGTSSESFLNSIPSSTNFCVTAKGGFDAVDSYFNITINGENVLAGDYDAWCADYNTSLNAGECPDSDVYTIFDDVSGVTYLDSATFGALNWLLNQDYVSQGYNMAHIQYAVWRLTEGGPRFSPWYAPYPLQDNEEEIAKAQEIYEFAFAQKGYVPNCGEDIAILLVPQDGVSQPVIITVPYNCEVGECDETAWGAAMEGCGFPGGSWATYFIYGEAGQ